MTEVKAGEVARRVWLSRRGLGWVVAGAAAAAGAGAELGRGFTAIARAESHGPPVLLEIAAEPPAELPGETPASTWRLVDLPQIRVLEAVRVDPPAPSVPERGAGRSTTVPQRHYQLHLTVELENATRWEQPYSSSYFRVLPRTAEWPPIVAEAAPGEESLGGGLLGAGASVRGVLAFVVPHHQAIRYLAYVIARYRRLIPLPTILGA
ncbi:MAG: hypothetical protein HY332_09510 [Chloroflexi bacterium]|nr:hypothetical protein [Chloroflexota bacterium]